MGNSLGGKRRAKVMKVDGSTVKVKPPALARDILRENPGHVLLESEQVKQLGVRAKPLDPDLPLKPSKLYFLVELPKLPPPTDRPHVAGTRRVRSGINMSAKDRLESLMLARRSSSDISFARVHGGADGDGDGSLRVRLRLPRAQVTRVVEESSDPAEAAEKIMELCTGAGGGAGARGPVGGRVAAAAVAGESPGPGKAVNGAIQGKKEKRMRFALTEDEIIG